MASALVRASLKSLSVNFNGDIDDKLAKQLRKIASHERKLKELEQFKTKPTVETINEIRQLYADIAKLKERAQDNAIVCKLSYPRSGSSSVESLKRVRLSSARTGGKPIVNAKPRFLDHGLFKEEIQGEAFIEVAITDSDPKNAFLQFVRRVLSTAFSTATKGIIGDISDVVTNSAATVLSKDIASALAGSDKKRVQLVAKSAKVALRVDAKGGLSASRLKGGATFENGILTLPLTAPQYLKVDKKTYLPRGAANGQIQLLLESEATHMSC